MCQMSSHSMQGSGDHPLTKYDSPQLLRTKDMAGRSGIGRARRVGRYRTGTALHRSAGHRV